MSDENVAPLQPAAPRVIKVKRPAAPKKPAPSAAPVPTAVDSDSAAQPAEPALTATSAAGTPAPPPTTVPVPARSKRPAPAGGAAPATSRPKIAGSNAALFQCFYRGAVQAYTAAAARCRPLTLSDLPPALLPPAPAAPTTAPAATAATADAAVGLRCDKHPFALPMLPHSLAAALALASLSLGSYRSLSNYGTSGAAPVLAIPAGLNKYLCASVFRLPLPLPLPLPASTATAVSPNAVLPAAASTPPPESLFSLTVPLLWLPHRSHVSGPLALAALPWLPLRPAPHLQQVQQQQQQQRWRRGDLTTGSVRCAERRSAARDCCEPLAAALAREATAAADAAAAAAAAAVGASEADSSAGAQESATVTQIVAAGLPLGPLAAAALPTAAAAALAADASAVAGEDGDGDLGDDDLEAATVELTAAIAALRMAQSEAATVAAQKARYDAHIARLHEYNEIKDVGQALLGMLAQVRGQGATTKDLYGEFGLELDD